MPETDLIIKLDSRRIPVVDDIGAKARNLMLLRRRGFPVPPGFCLTCSAYDLHVCGGPKDAIAELKNARKAARPGILTRIGLLISDIPVPPRLIQELSAYYTKLRAPLMAVRSSATGEDQARLSFAGQYETILGVSSFGGLQDAVKKCWASLWSQRVYEYCRKNRIDHASLKMAVIVQRQVPADFAGVCFTQDPSTGRKDRVVIEYVQGLGDKLVSGRATPERITVAKRGGKTIAATGKIDPELIKKLGRQAAGIEKRFGGPQDIEWAAAGKRLFFLQTRPVTASAPAVKREDREVWTNANAGEVLPDVVTPLTWSVANPVIMAIFNSALSVIGADLEENTVCGLICGRAYFNINQIAGLLLNIPGFKNFDISTVFGGAQGEMGKLGKITITREDIPVIRIKLSRAALCLPIRLTKMITLLWSNEQKYLVDFKARIAPFEKIDPTSRSDHDLLEAWQELMDRMCDGMRENGYSGMAMLFLPNLDRACRKWLGSKPGVMANQLVAGIGGMDSAGSGLALCELARTARSDKRLAEVLLKERKWTEARKRISRMKAGRGFLDAWDGFMARHGHHARSEIEISYPRWSETPDYVLGMVRNILTAEEHEDALEHYRRTVERRLSLTRECLGRLKNPLKRMVFNFYLTRAQRGSVIRENLKNTLIIGLRVVRRICLEAGRRLKERKIIGTAEDVYFMTMEELRTALVSGDAGDIKKTVARRRAEYKRNLGIRPPPVIQGRFDPDSYRPEPVDTKIKTMKGLAVSSGKVRGKARIILDTRSRDTVRPGEVLVAPFTDPGWTPYFMSAAAIVVDMGGLLSHGSIVAREYGIPAVVNVGPATRIIKTGQTVEVDGNQGTVKIL